MSTARKVWKAGGGWVPLSLYGLQLVLNWAWTPLFFGKKDLGLALADITGTLFFYRIARGALL